MLRMFGAIVGCLFLSALTLSANEAQSYPTGPVALVVPLPPGGTLDVIARIVAQKLADRLGVSVIVENRPGAGTLVGTRTVAGAAPDGQTLLMGGTAGLAVNPSLFKSLPYDPLVDFEPIALVIRVPLILAVSATLPIHSLAELLDYARASPDKLFYASSGQGTQLHLAGELLQAQAGIELEHIPYDGAMTGLADVAAGRVQMIFADPTSARPYIEAGTVRAIGLSSTARIPSMPDIIPISEQGMPNFEAVVWIMIVAPAKTPETILDRLHDEITAIMAMPDVRQRIVDLGAIPDASVARDQLKPFLQSEISRWSSLIERAGLTGLH